MIYSKTHPKRNFWTLDFLDFDCRRVKEKLAALDIGPGFLDIDIVPDYEAMLAELEDFCQELVEDDTE